MCIETVVSHYLTLSFNHNSNLFLLLNSIKDKNKRKTLDHHSFLRYNVITLTSKKKIPYTKKTIDNAPKREHPLIKIREPEIEAEAVK